jgi:hypothetical protein
MQASTQISEYLCAFCGTVFSESVFPNHLQRYEKLTLRQIEYLVMSDFTYPPNSQNT